MKIVGFDIDGTITTNDSKYNLVRELYPHFDENIHYTIYPLMESLRLHGFIKNGDARNIYEDSKDIALGCGTFYATFVELHSYLKGRGVEMHFITARKPAEEIYTKRLFEQNGIPYVNVHHVGSMDKIAVLKQHKIEMFFEDNVHNIDHITAQLEIPLGFIETPYNKNYVPDNPHIYMFRQWGNVLRYFKDTYEG